MDPPQFQHIVVSDNDVHSIVMSYLLHNCYNETADSLASTTGTKQPEFDRDNMETRKQMMRFVLEKKSLKATEQLGQQDFLEKNKDLHFHLLCLHFLELICADKCPEAVEFAETRLAVFGNVPKYVTELQTIMALLPCDIEDPETSQLLHHVIELVHLLSAKYRQLVADKLNRAILEHANQLRYTPMERLLQQVTVARHYLTGAYGKDAFPPFSLDDSLKRERSQDDALQSLLGEGFCFSMSSPSMVNSSKDG